MKELYERAEVEVLYLQKFDVIATSVPVADGEGEDVEEHD